MRPGTKTIESTSPLPGAIAVAHLVSFRVNSWIVFPAGVDQPVLERRILCSEDDADTRELFVWILEGSDYNVTVSESSEDALALARSEQFDLLLVDNWMPGLSGEELTREVRRFNGSTPILFYSGAA